MVDRNKIIDLSGFIGSEHFYRDQLGVLITDGVKYFATEGKAFWAVSDMIVICKLQERVKKEGFVSITISCKEGKGNISYSNGNGDLLFIQEYKICSLPNGTWKFYYLNNTLICESEY